MIIEEPIEDVTVLHASQDPRTAVYHARLTRLLTEFPHGAAPQVGHYPCHPARRKATSTLLPHGGVCSLVDQVVLKTTHRLAHLPKTIATLTREKSSEG